MFWIFKEGLTVLRLAYYELALTQMGVLHEDLPANVIKARDLREQLNAIRGFSA